MSQLLVSTALATGLVAWLVREVLVDHGRVVRHVARGHDRDRRARTDPVGTEAAPRS